MEVWHVGGGDEVEDGLLDLSPRLAEDEGLDAVVLELAGLGDVVDDEEGFVAAQLIGGSLKIFLKSWLPGIGILERGKGDSGRRKHGLILASILQERCQQNPKLFIREYKEQAMNARKSLPRIFAVLILLSLSFVLTFSASASADLQAEQPPVGSILQSSSQQGFAPQGGGPVTGGPGYVSVNAYDFRPADNTYTYVYATTALINNNAGWKPFFAPVQLPQGAVINQMVAYYLDNNTSYDLSVTLIQINYFSNTVVNMATFGSTGSNTTWTYNTTSTFSQPTIDNSRFSYAIRVDLPPASNVLFNGVRVDYGYPVMLPVISK